MKVIFLDFDGVLNIHLFIGRDKFGHKNNLNYFQWMLLRNKKTIYDKGR